MAENPDPIILTDSQRAYLKGDKDYTRQTELNTRREIRTRIQRALFDLQFLATHLEPRDRQQIFVDIRPPLKQGNPLSENFQPYREPVLEATIDSLALLLVCAHDAGVPFDRLLRQTVLRAEEPEIGGPMTVGEFTINFEVDPTIEFEALRKRLRADDELSEAEYLQLTRTFVADSEEFQEATADIDLEYSAALERGSSLSRGRSIVLLARAMHSETDLPPEQVDRLLHERVRTELFPDSM